MGKEKAGSGGGWYNWCVMWQKLDRAALVVVRWVRGVAIAALLVVAVAAVILGLEDTINTNWAAALVALCAATLLVLGTRFEPEISAPAIAKALGVGLAIPAAWFWFVSAHDPGTPQRAIALALVALFATAVTLVVLVALYVWILRWWGRR